MGIFSIKEPIKKAEEESRLVLDLDQVKPKPLRFRLNGQDHVIHPIKVEDFAEVYSKCSEIDRMIKSGEVKHDEMARIYAKVFNGICSTITKECVDQMTKDQCDKLLLLMFRVFSGEAFNLPTIEEPNPAAEKKTLQG